MRVRSGADGSTSSKSTGANGDLKGPVDKNRRRIWSAQDEKPSRHGDCLRICTYNCRTIASKADQTILNETSKRLRFDVIALQETKTKETAIKKTNDGHLFVLGAKVDGKNVGGVGFLVHRRIEHLIDSTEETKTKETAIKKTYDGHLFVLGAKVDGKNVGGVGFLVHRRIEHLIDSTEVLSPRLAILRLRIDKRTTVSIINCYAPTSTATDGEKDAFYKELEQVTKNERSYYKYVVGDFNAVIHEESPATARTGPHGIGVTNENGERLMDLLEACNLFHGNSFFVKNEGRRWTWESSDS
uniref:Endonuclease exonuclease phosphatase domain containing protein n=1 Tax=Haemonchus contortus TaxID=6289 RepID=W6NAJ6_HAECO